MIKDLKENPLDYLVLIAILLFGVILYILFKDDAVMERIIAISLALSYILWGIIHHHHADKVTSKIVLEYILVAVLGFLVINSLLIGR
jgi:hypothetical protein